MLFSSAEFITFAVVQAFRSLKLLFVFILLFCLFSNGSMAALKVDITRGNSELLSVVIAEFASQSGGEVESKIASEMSKIVKKDLDSSGLFSVEMNGKLGINDKAMPISGWVSSLGSAEVLVTSSIRVHDHDSLEVKFRLWEASTGKQIVGKMLTSDMSSIRRTAHIIADNVYHSLVGEKGYFDTRVVYIAEKGNSKRIAIMDHDGANNVFLTDGKNLVLTPRFSPGAQKIVYMSYASGGAKIHVRDIDTGKDELLGNYRGVYSAPRFAPKGKKVLMSRSLGGVTDIYEVNLITRRRKKLTVQSAINTSASFSPDEKHVVFNSDRGGRPKVYVMDADGSNQHRISFGAGTYTTPVWSPRGDLIAFTKIVDRGFHIGVMRPDGSGERLIAKGYLVESPTWAPNGRVVVFTKETKQGRSKISRIHSVDFTGINERVLPTDPEYQVYDPSWSSLQR